MQLPTRGYLDTLQAFVKRIATVTETPYVNLLPALRQSGMIETIYLLRYDPTQPRDEKGPFFPERTQYTGNGHMSRFGYFVVAQTIVNTILEKGIVQLPPSAVFRMR